MRHAAPSDYLSPDIEVVEIDVEMGFSGSQLPEYEEDDDHIVLW